MTEAEEKEEIERTNRYVISTIHNNESAFFHSFLYGALAMFIYLVSNQLEYGNLMGVTNILGLASLYMWWKTNPWFLPKSLEAHMKNIKSNEIIERYQLHVSKARKAGSASLIIMLIAIYYVGWVHYH